MAVGSNNMAKEADLSHFEKDTQIHISFKDTRIVTELQMINVEKTGRRLCTLGLDLSPSIEFDECHPGGRI